ncbi:helix-turn-helix transcriptional regulator [Chitinophaga sp. CB10]|uniref:helix-turn-helix domain-containing protein n=1 Tax=Chitinophaga sp. CB10 TaxID=1891659 RepID=UPI0025C241DC|nr:helix-turn-helix transcriptional regulator [Chitinophaga sp. CB10]
MSKYQEELLNFAYNVEAARNKMGWTQADLAGEMEAVESYLNKILNARRYPGFNMIHRIAEALKMPASDLLKRVASEEELRLFREQLEEKHRRNLERKKQEKAAARREKPAPPRNKKQL